MIELAFTKDKNGLVPAIVQDHRSGEVLMLAYINETAWKKTLRRARPITGAGHATACG